MAGTKNRIMPKRKLPQDDIVIKQYKNGNSTYVLAKKYNCHWTAIRRVLRKHNIKLRKSGFKKGNENYTRNNCVLKNNGTYISAGYKFIMAKKHPLKNNLGYVREHRLVVEKILGRILKKEEVIHHIDGNKLNNKIDNLMVMSNSEHITLHAKLRRQNGD